MWSCLAVATAHTPRGLRQQAKGSAYSMVRQQEAAMKEASRGGGWLRVDPAGHFQDTGHSRDSSRLNTHQRF